ncbi:hypothetical protein B0I35DRAFT_435441 [Stachybotrys elegans]|uniref:Uncharacterized protein n=1 Tax=Stachybotrys elegans TaxID=80388 RepID=A0A8K0WP92_9HYPO|nr:hypothetical protein B0I35DRAFT_435441 [Stachybotrys elegans]
MSCPPQGSPLCLVLAELVPSSRRNSLAICGLTLALSPSVSHVVKLLTPVHWRRLVYARPALASTSQRVFWSALGWSSCKIAIYVHTADVYLFEGETGRSTDKEQVDSSVVRNARQGLWILHVRVLAEPAVCTLPLPMDSLSLSLGAASPQRKEEWARLASGTAAKLGHSDQEDEEEKVAFANISITSIARITMGQCGAHQGGKGESSMYQPICREMGGGRGTGCLYVDQVHSANSGMSALDHAKKPNAEKLNSVCASHNRHAQATTQLVHLDQLIRITDSPGEVEQTFILALWASSRTVWQWRQRG